MNILLNIYLFFLLFNNIFFNIIEVPSFFSYWDEAIEIIIILWMIIASINNKKLKIDKRNWIIFVSTMLIVIIGVGGNVAFGYASSGDAIFRDVISFLKFPLTFVLIQYLKLDNAMVKAINQHTIILIKGIIIVMFLLGFLSLFIDVGLSQNEVRYGLRPYQFLFSHPTYLVLCSIFLISILESINGVQNKQIYEVMLFFVIVMTLRTKGIAVAAVYIYTKYASKWLNRFKVLYWGVAGGIALGVGYDKLMLYSSWASSPREVLYKGSVQLAMQGFPWGSGFATFASHISWRSNSAVYSFIEIPFTWSNGKWLTTVLGDAGFAYYIGQFGIIGTILFIVILFQLYKIITKNSKINMGMLVLFIYILIALTSESTLINNGIEIAFIMTTVLKMAQNEN